MGRRIIAGAPKSPKNVTSTFINPVNLLPKELRCERGGVKLASCTGRHLTSSRPCMQRHRSAKDRWIVIKKQIITKLNCDKTNDIKDQIVTKLNKDSIFSLKLDESIDVARFSQLLAHVPFPSNSDIEKHFLFCRTLNHNHRRRCFQCSGQLFQRQHDWLGQVFQCMRRRRTKCNGMSAKFCSKWPTNRLKESVATQ